ncbi:MAG TPA: ribbon-helix-helix protein, CopG family [Syntrophales bacterium]|nr:ribbon-helix-helix protein, CopG family [Syntrophales bacterium]
MGRKPVQEPKQQYSVKLRPSVVAEIDEMAEENGLTRSQLMGNLIESGLEDMKILKKTGIFAAVRIGEKIMRKFKEAVYSGKVSLTKDDELEIRK